MDMDIGTEIACGSGGVGQRGKIGTTIIAYYTIFFKKMSNSLGNETFFSELLRMLSLESMHIKALVHNQKFQKFKFPESVKMKTESFSHDSVYLILII